MTDEYAEEMRRIWAALPEAERARLRAMHGQPVTLHDYQLTEDVDGDPLGVETTEYDGTFMLPAEWREEGDE